MELLFTKDQAKKLLLYATIGFHVIATNKETREEPTKDETDFLNSLYKKAYEADHEFIDQDAEIGYAPTKEFDEIILDELSEFETENAFEILSEMLALRDIEDAYPNEELSKMNEETFDTLLDEYVEAYDSEFFENGVQNLYLIEEVSDENQEA